MPTKLQVVTASRVTVPSEATGATRTPRTQTHDECEEPCDKRAEMHWSRTRIVLGVCTVETPVLDRCSRARVPFVSRLEQPELVAVQRQELHGCNHGERHPRKPVRPAHVECGCAEGGDHAGDEQRRANDVGVRCTAHEGKEERLHV